MAIRVIQIGVGGFGEEWQHALKTIPDVEVAALVDISQDALDRAASVLHVPKERCFLGDDTAWPELTADMVLDASPQLNHHRHAMQAFDSGKHLLVVKPMSDDWETGQAMVQAAQERGLKMVVAQQLRFHPVILKVREIVQSGVLGQIGYIHQDAFFGKRGYTGSYPQAHPLLVQASIHHFDYLRWVLGQDAVGVWADCWNPPWIQDSGIRAVHVAFEMAGGCRVCYRSVPSAADSANWTCHWRVEGNKGLIKVIDDRVFLNGEELPVAWEDGKDIRDLNLSVLNKHVFELFIRYLMEDEEPGISGRNNLNSLEMAFGAINASETGQRYQLVSAC